MYMKLPVTEVALSASNANLRLIMTIFYAVSKSLALILLRAVWFSTEHYRCSLAI